MKLYYLPLEPYAERYTALMSCKDGWAETKFKELNVDFERIEGEKLGTTIKNGVVLDACGRSHYAMSQLLTLIKKINNNEVQDGDIIYVEDFWHPGIESLFYIRQLTNKKFKIGTFIHAQSVDDSDFSYAMRDWMRPIEQGFGKQYDFIFTCSHILRKICIEAGIANENNIFTVGLPYNSKRLLEQLKDMGVEKETINKNNTVLFSSRFDQEKDPMFYLQLVRECPDISFVLVNPRKDRPISNSQEVINELNNVLATCNNLKVVDTSNKPEYYKTLAEAKIVFNCAHQDWVSWTLLEAITFNCLPLYPIWKDFPYELDNDNRYLYVKRDIEDAKKHLYALLQDTFNSDLQKVVDKHDNSWNNYIKIMRG